MEKVIETPEFILSMPWRWRRNFSPRYHYNFKQKGTKRKEKKRKIWSGRFCWINHLFRDLVKKYEELIFRFWVRKSLWATWRSVTNTGITRAEKAPDTFKIILPLDCAEVLSRQQQRWPREIRKTAAFPSLLLLLCSSKRHNRPAKHRNLDKTTKILTAKAFYLTLISL